MANAACGHPMRCDVWTVGQEHHDIGHIVGGTDPPDGDIMAMVSRCWSCLMTVSVGPGDMALTVMFRGPGSPARVPTICVRDRHRGSLIARLQGRGHDRGVVRCCAAGHYSGLYWSATMRDHVIYESRLGLAQSLMAVQDRAVEQIYAQPLLLTRWRRGRPIAPCRRSDCSDPGTQR